ncbi:carbohydrate sulfotransferase 13-like [Watersipora subatra]|uniref:carbohydrate sulfotransferase 13-like n=1 Tax=Watersipora subatra TaxID=2589382 RepID=UPI00355C568F
MTIMCSTLIVFQTNSRLVLTVMKIEQPSVSSHYSHVPEVERISNGSTMYTHDNKRFSEFNRLINGQPSSQLFRCPGSIGKQHLCQHYVADWVGKTDIKRVLETRIHRIRERCSQYHEFIYNASLSKYGTQNNSKQFTMKRVLTNRKLNLAMCWVPKTGSTFMKHAWTPLNKLPARSLPHQPKRNNSLSSLYLHDFWSSPKQLSKDSYTVFTVSRNPWQRLVSVYREKCEQTGSLHLCKLNFGEACSRRSTHVTFQTFLECVIDMMVEERTEYYGHVETSYKRCGICDYPYNYVVLFENLASETEYIFKEAGVIDPHPVMERVRNQSIRAIEKVNPRISYANYWKGIPPVLIDNVRFLYRYEIMLFNYPETPFLL